MMKYFGRLLYCRVSWFYMVFIIVIYWLKVNNCEEVVKNFIEKEDI